MHIFEKKEKYRFFLKCFDFWMMRLKYSCSADENTWEKCRHTEKFFFSFGLYFLLFFRKYACLGKFFEVTI